MLKKFLIATCIAAIATASMGQDMTVAPEDAAVQLEQLATRYQEAEALRRGIGLDVDLQRSFDIHSELAALGYTDSLTRLAYFHAQGIHVPQDLEQAAGEAEEAKPKPKPPKPDVEPEPEAG